MKYYREKFSDTGFSFKAFSLKSVLIGVLAGITIFSVLQLVFFPVIEQFVEFEETDVGLYDFIKEGKWNYLFILIMGWVVGGFYEEIVFHGFNFPRLEKMITGKHSLWISFLITSIIFGAYHGLALYFKRNLWFSIISHGVYDTIVITLIYLGYLV